MEDNENPYTILGVPQDATQQQIKAAYRKLALKHHPDKQSTEEGRQQATVHFAKISNAYEILGDETQRLNYDREASGRVNRPWSKHPRQGYDDNHFFHHAHFHDPFSVFESVFREEFGGDFFGNSHFNNNRQNSNRRSTFDDPFFGGHGGSMFGNDPFFGGGGGGFGGDPFFGGGGMMGGGIFAAMNQHMNNMMNMQQSMQQQVQVQGQHPSLPGNNGNRQTFVYSSTSSSNLMGGNTGESVTKSTTTRIINGKRQVVTERIVRKADGTVERHFEQSGDEDFPGGQPQLSYHSDGRQQQQTLGWQPEQALPPQQQQPERRSSSKSSKPQRQDSKPKRSLFKRKRRNSSNVEDNKD